jgi:cell division inhibitor SepF
MSGFRNKLWDALGLSDGDSYPDYEPYEEQAPPTRPVRQMPPFGGQNQNFGSQAPYPGTDPETVSNVRALPIVPADGGVGPVQVRPIPSATGSVRPIPAPAAPKVHLVTPVSFHDAQEIGERFRSNQPVIINLGGVDRDLKRRLVDFAAGLIFGLNGEMQRVAESVFMLTPKNVEVSADERRKLQERGLLN